VDSQRFDALVRSLGTPVARRPLTIGVLISLLGIRPQRTRAQSLLGPGEPCTATAQCDQSGGLLVCADNMLAEDGPLNCCRVEGGACGEHRHCCGTLDCVNGSCIENGPSIPGNTPVTGTPGTLPLGAACSTTEECGTVASGSVICGDNMQAEDGPLNCCLEAGSACSISSHCCGIATCDAGFCGGATATVAAGDDFAPGDPCSSDEQCSQSLGPAICGDNSGSGGATICCLTESSTCTNDQECCGARVCATNGISSDGGKNCCSPEGAYCSSDSGCCGDLFCFDAVCGPLW